MRIAVIANMLDPNRVALFERVQRRGDAELLVVYETVMEANRSWTAPVDLPYRHEILRSHSLDLHPIGADGYLHLPRRPLAPIRAFRPDVVVAAGGGIWSSPANIRAFAARRREGWAFVPWWGSWSRDRPSLVRRLAEPWVRQFFSHSDLCIAYGTRATAELLQFGVPAAAIRTVPNAVPPGGTGHEEPRPHRPLRYLFVGQLIERKGVPELIAAFSNLPDGELHVAGDGPLEPLVARAARSGKVIHHGHLGGPELHALYARSDVLVLPSRYEVWGLVVNEALEHGLPIVATDNVGAGDDLILPGVNGYVCRAGDVAGLQEVLDKFADWSDTQWGNAASAGAEMARRWSIDAAADAFLEACEASILRRRSRLDERLEAVGGPAS